MIEYVKSFKHQNILEKRLHISASAVPLFNPDIPQSEGVFNMPTKEVDGNLLKRLIINGSINLKNNSQTINDLNVFPVPDGDTGSNMQSTMMSGVDSIDSLKNEPI